MHLVSDLKKPVPEGHKRVKILKHVMQFSPNDVVDCKEETAAILCQQSSYNDGSKVVKYHKALHLADFEKLLEDSRDPEKNSFTVDEMDAMGIKNIVETPKDPIFERNLEIAKQASQNAQDEQTAVDEAKKNRKKKG